MDALIGYDILAWLNLALRWAHVLVGICWIGASFYFVWLDNHLVEPDPPQDGVKGELWAVHGGGFYQSRKFLLKPPKMPEHLHWFMWEAYSTWISGFLLLVVVYYFGASIYLIDKTKLALDPWQAIGLSLAFIFGGLAVYEGLCRSPLAKRPGLFGLVWFLVLVAAAWAQTRLFSDRAAFLQVGAMIGTVMVANVKLVIIPNQRKSVAAVLAGETPDPRWGAQGRLRSVQNNYMTLPVIFLMISNHYPVVTGHPLNWLLVALLSAAGLWHMTQWVCTMACACSKLAVATSGNCGRSLVAMKLTPRNSMAPMNRNSCRTTPLCRRMKKWRTETPAADSRATSSQFKGWPVTTG